MSRKTDATRPREWRTEGANRAIARIAAHLPRFEVIINSIASGPRRGRRAARDR